MKQARTRIAHTIADTTLRKGVSKQYVKQTAAYLLQEGRVGELDSLLRDIQLEWAQSGHVEVIASSAHDLTPAVQKEIETTVKQLYPEALKIVINEVHDPEVIGGVRLSMPNQQLDLSIEAKLNRFKQLTKAGKE
jgi:F0F1-type ATP synthase delta subunit